MNLTGKKSLIISLILPTNETETVTSYLLMYGMHRFSKRRILIFKHYDVILISYLITMVTKSLFTPRMIAIMIIFLAPTPKDENVPFTLFAVLSPKCNK